MKDTLLYGTVAIILLLVFSVVTAEGAATSVDTRPGRISTFQYESAAGKIIISAGSPGDYSISIVGVPDSWLEYDDDVYVEDEEVVSYVVSPQKAGSYYLSIIVEGPDDYYFEDEVSLWAGKSGAPEPEAAEEEEDSISGGLAGMAASGEQNQAVLMALAIIVASVVAVFLAYRTFSHGETREKGLNF